ncbi:MAG: imidazole glycerol phosphate synthase subunit HisF [Rhodocyclales bacterium]|nr:imidazole glycerol phosphate synthase subunit HisF [Rhodocyclales bacterium]
MLKRRLIPKLQLRSMRLGNADRMVLVTTVRFDQTVQVGDPISQAKVYQAQMADELIFLDLDATLQGRPTMAGIVERAAEEIFMPLTVGGGVRSLDDFRKLLRHGADKVSINTAAVESPELIERAADAFGAQCVVVSIDFSRTNEGRYSVFTRGGKHDSGLDPVEWARTCARRGAGEILLTSIDRDGTRAGLDVETTRRVASEVSVPVIASGGCGTAAHFVEGFSEGMADAVAAGTFFSLKDQTPLQIRARIGNAGIPIRPQT